MKSVNFSFLRYRCASVLLAVLASAFICTPRYFAAVPSAGGNTTVVNPTGEGAVSINEDAVQPESANIRLIVSTLSDSGGGTPGSIRILSVSGGTLWQGDGSSITLGSAGTVLSLFSTTRVDLRFRPDAGRDTNATFQYVVIDPHNSSINSSASTATIPITAVNDAPVLQTISGNTGLGLAATYYLNAWDLTGTTYQRIDATVNFSNNFSVLGYNDENFSVRWTGQVKSPITGNVTFSTLSDDGVRLWVNDVLVIDNWTLHGSTVDTSGPISLVEGEKYNLRMEFYERGGAEVAVLRWAYSDQGTQIIPQAYLFPATTRPALSYVNGSASAIIDDAIAVSDVDSPLIASGAVIISSNYVSDEDSLLFTNQNGIVGTLDSNTLRLNGSASLANYQTALRSVRYANSAASPDTSTRTITFSVTDTNNGESNETYRNIEFAAENTPPVITEGTSVSVTMDEDASPTAFSLTLNATDADYQSISWSISGAASHGTASVSGNGDSKEISYVPVTNYYGSDSFVVQISDGNGGTDTITVNVTITDRTPPVISDIASGSLTGSSALITWTTDESASTKVSYGVGTSYGSNTSETDTSSRVISHSKTVWGLHACTTYYYAVVSADAASNTSTAAGGSFTTSGCAGEATISSGTGSNVIHNANGSTGSIVLPNNSLSLTVPIGYIDTNLTCPTGAYFQLKALSSAPVKTELGSPSGRDTIVNAFNLSAYCPNLTPVTEFDDPLTIVFTYSDADVSGLVESSLGAYRYGSGSTVWEALTCSQDTSANTLTCSTVAFSSFGIFGTPVSTPASATSVGTTQNSGGCRGSNCHTGVQRPAPTIIQPSPNHQAAGKSPACSKDTLPHANGLLKLTMQSHPIIFEDVPVTEWFSCPVHEVISSGFFSGYRDETGDPTGRYGPTDSISLEQLAKVATQLKGMDISQGEGNEWAQPFVDAAKTMHLTAFSKKINPRMPASRGEVLQTILEALSIPLTGTDLSYSDVPAGSRYATAIATGTALGIVSGDGEATTFRPNASINRAEVAKMIIATLGVLK